VNTITKCPCGLQYWKDTPDTVCPDCGQAPLKTPADLGITVKDIRHMMDEERITMTLPTQTTLGPSAAERIVLNRARSQRTKTTNRLDMTILEP